MKKIIFFGRTGCGKTTLVQAMRGEAATYRKTQSIDHVEVVIDTPGEYAEVHSLSRAIALFSYEADVVGLVLSATEPYSLYSPNITGMVNREVIGIVTHIDSPDANPDRARRWLELAGCKKIFYVNSLTNEGVEDILAYLKSSDQKE